MIHACGMVDLADDLDWSTGVGHVIRAALADGAPILTDSMMLADGITRQRLPADNVVHCFLRDESVAERAARQGTTRSAAAVDAWRGRLGGASQNGHAVANSLHDLRAARLELLKREGAGEQRLLRARWDGRHDGQQERGTQADLSSHHAAIIVGRVAVAGSVRRSCQVCAGHRQTASLVEESTAVSTVISAMSIAFGGALALGALTFMTALGWVGATF